LIIIDPGVNSALQLFNKTIYNLIKETPQRPNIRGKIVTALIESLRAVVDSFAGVARTKTTTRVEHFMIFLKKYWTEKCYLPHIVWSSNE
jgi:hypothetical protein